MPRGKGTYGSQVGRPPKKQKKYQEGGEVLEAAAMGQELESIPLGGIEPEIPTSNAMERSETYQLGGAVKPPTSPSIPQYKKGGKVKQGSLKERISTGIQNRQNFKERKKKWGVEEARKAFEEDTLKQRMKRTEAKRQTKIKKAEAKKRGKKK